MVFSAGHRAPLPVSEPGCWQTRSRGQMASWVRRTGSYKTWIPPFPFLKATVLHLEDGHTFLHLHPKGSPCTPMARSSQKRHAMTAPHR